MGRRKKYASEEDRLSARRACSGASNKRHEDRVKAYAREYKQRPEVKARESERANARYHAEPKRKYTANRKWRIKNPGGHILGRAVPRWADANTIAELYKARDAACDLFGVPIEVDHIVPLRSNKVCGLHCEGNLQLLPAVVNAAKSNRKWPDMW
jgi:hypothetical protein